MSEAITKALDDFEIQAITTAYEQGFGHAWRTELINPYPDGTTTRTAWQYGRDAGQRQTPQPAPSPQPDVSVVSDEQIDALAAGNNYPGTVPGYRRFARAILALRPQAVPMTPEQMRRAAMDEMNKIPALANHHSWKGWPGTWAFATAAVNGITAKAEGGA